jgi:hypothetical protein
VWVKVWVWAWGGCGGRLLGRRGAAGPIAGSPQFHVSLYRSLLFLRPWDPRGSECNHPKEEAGQRQAAAGGRVRERSTVCQLFSRASVFVCSGHVCACMFWVSTCRARARYDSEDPFIDDSEVVAHVEQVDQMAVQTKHTGFYVHNNSAIAAAPRGYVVSVWLHASAGPQQPLFTVGYLPPPPHTMTLALLPHSF